MITIKKFYNGMTDAVFKAIFCKEENKDLLKRLIETSLQKEVEIIKIIPPEIIKPNVYAKNKTLDVIVKCNEKIINIEVNGNQYTGLYYRNFSYITAKYIDAVKKGQSYNDMPEIIQINFNVNDKETNPPFLQLSMRDIKYPEIDLIDNFKVYVFNLDKIDSLCYNKENKYEFLKLLNADQKELQKLSRKDKDMKKFEKEITNLNNDEEFTSWLSSEEDNEKLKNTLIGNAKEAGIKEGMSQGINQRNKEIARNMLNKNMDSKIIAEITGLSLKELEDLK